MNSQDYPLSQDVEGWMKDEYDFIMGIDEAGRGPVLGPMVYGACYCPEENENRISKLGFNDSKQLTEKQRESLFSRIISVPELMGYIVDVIQPEVLSEKMLRKAPVSLNVISHQSAIGLVRAVLAKGIKISTLYLDTVGPPQKYQDMLVGLFPEIRTIIVSKKADSLFPIVSAASICAKVIRDHCITSTRFDQLNENADPKQKIGTNFGSGYPGDPLTKKWIVDSKDKVFGYPKFIRYSWKTTTEAMQGDCYGVEWTGASEAQNKLKNFVQPPTTTNAGSKRKRFMFFEENQISNCIEDF
ncbi:hypothetical protein CYY_003428 [Polysphondylium violaceum]|uniref:Ribonuclease n=1 Tax=Polysphondylium violaceum TaxID=133409 RepID=A0A8J4PZ93_9MYCE|nr:hypothetical protein CYY_003428 [Polysphondylium violaceum]